MRLSICYKLIRGDPAVSARFSLKMDESRLSRSQASINSNRHRVGGIPLTLSLIKSKQVRVDSELTGKLGSTENGSQQTNLIDFDLGNLSGLIGGQTGNRPSALEVRGLSGVGA